jgi:hypothetical protein
VGSKEQHVHGHYQALLAQQAEGGVEGLGYSQQQLGSLFEVHE